MNTSNKISDFKALGRQSLDGKSDQFIICIIIYLVANGFISFLSTAFPIGANSVERMIFYVIFFLSYLITFKIDLGLTGFFMDLVFNKRTNSKKLFSHLLKNSPASTNIAIICGGLKLFCFTPSFISIANLIGSGTTGLIITICLILLSLFLYIYLDIALFPIAFLSNDIPNASAMQLFLLSLWLMKKHKKQLLLMKLSFIGMYIATLTSFGIGYLWVKPYVMSSYTHFYIALCNEKEFSK